MPDVWTLHTEPHRHYKLNGSWSIKGVGHIVSITSVLDSASGLADWSARQAVAACEDVACDWLGAEAPLRDSVLSFAELARLQRAWPDNVRDEAGARGTAAHAYFAARMDHSITVACPYGFRTAIDLFASHEMPIPIYDDAGPRLERAVGDAGRAVAGTYDGQVVIRRGKQLRLDVKTSRTVCAKHFAQLAAYERCAVLCGEEPSDYLTVLHLLPTGTYQLYSIEEGSPEHDTALALFDAHLAIYRATPKLDKLIRARTDA